MNKLDPDKLTLGEIATIEDLSGRSISTLDNEEAPMGKMLAALAMIAKRRNGEPKFTWGDALALTMEEAQEAVGLDGDEESDDEPQALPQGDEVPANGRPTSAPKASRAKSS